MTENDNFIKGADAEDYVMAELLLAGLKDPQKTMQTEFYDILLGTNIFIEVKSAEIRTSSGIEKGSRWGRFIINKCNHEKLIEKKGWYVLVLTFKKQPLLLRFIEAKKADILNYPTHSFITLATLYKGISMDDFKDEFYALNLPDGNNGGKL